MSLPALTAARSASTDALRCTASKPPTPFSVQRCLDNGRALQELLYEAAPRYIKALKRERAKTAKQ